MRKISTIIFLTLLSYHARAQVNIGLSTGMIVYNRLTSPILVVDDLYTVEAQSRTNPRFLFGVFVTNKIFGKGLLKQELVIYPGFVEYYYQAPPLEFYNTLTHFNYLNYRALLRVFRTASFSVKAGPGADFVFLSQPLEEPYFSDLNPEAARLAKAVDNSYARAILYADVEAGWQIKWLSLHVNYKHALTFANRQFQFNEKTYRLQSRSSQVFIRLGIRIFSITGKDK